MSELQLHKAERKRVKLRVGLFGASGSGKTMSALKLARGFAPWEKIAVIDTENGSGELYSHLGEYQVVTLVPPFAPEKYIEAIKMCEAAGMQVIIIDSITHEWAGQGGILEIVDMAGKDGKNAFTAWGKITPRHNRFIDAILQSPVHIICCGRSKQEYVLNEREGKNGKTISVPEKIGLKAVTREGFDYEMTVTWELSQHHLATSTKDRTGIFQDKPEMILDESHGKQLLDWTMSGKIDPMYLKKEIMRHIVRLGVPEASLKEPGIARQAIINLTGIDPTDEANYQPILDILVLKTRSEVDIIKPKPPEEQPPKQGDDVGSFTETAVFSSGSGSGEDGGRLIHQSVAPTVGELGMVDGQEYVGEFSPTSTPGVHALTKVTPVAVAPHRKSTELIKYYGDKIKECMNEQDINAVFEEAGADQDVFGHTMMSNVVNGLITARLGELGGSKPVVEAKPTMLMCQACEGNGHMPDGGQCTECFGNGIV